MRDKLGMNAVPQVVCRRSYWGHGSEEEKSRRFENEMGGSADVTQCWVDVGTRREGAVKGDSQVSS